MYNHHWTNPSNRIELNHKPWICVTITSLHTCCITNEPALLMCHAGLFDNLYQTPVRKTVCGNEIVQKNVNGSIMLLRSLLKCCFLCYPFGYPPKTQKSQLRNVTYAYVIRTELPRRALVDGKRLCWSNTGSTGLPWRALSAIKCVAM